MLASFFRTLGLISLCIVLLFSGIAGYGYYDYTSPGALAQPATVIFLRGEHGEAIADKLAASGVIRFPFLFRLEAYASGHAHAFKAGEYAFPPVISPQGVIAMLAAGRVVVHKVTVAEGLTVADVAALLAAAPRLMGDMPQGIAEGSLLPETYQYLYGDTREMVVRRMQQAMRKLLAELWEKRQPGLPFATPEEALTLASIVEKETGVDSERGQVARVFLNRLKLGMKLQSDPTVTYGLTLAHGPLRRPLTNADLQANSPYNTYVIPGLPPGPICNPGKAALDAALNPPPGDALYFVATGSGGHYFARTLEEHNANVQRYRQKMRGP